jgi:hypothetical protein
MRTIQTRKRAQSGPAVHLSLTAARETREALETLANAKGISLAGLMRRILKRYVKDNHGAVLEARMLPEVSENGDE